MDLPIVHVLELGGEEFYGVPGINGEFRPISSLQEAGMYPVELFGANLGLLKPCTASIVINDVPVGTVNIGVTDGRPGCVSIHSTTHALTGSLLRQIPLARLVREAAIANTVRVMDTKMGVLGARYVEGGPGFGQLLEDLRAELTAVDELGRRRVINASFLKMVAHIYRTALRLGKNPSKHVEDMLGPTSPANARRWISAARREGYLGPAPGPGRAGEIIQEVSVSS